MLWCPYNEAANRAAKETAEHNPAAPEPDSLRTPTATTKPIIRKTMRVEWDIAWENAKYGRELFRLTVRPGKDVLTTHAGAHRAIISVITQTHTSKISLRAYLAILH
jgi:hypothetical protein